MARAATVLALCLLLLVQASSSRAELEARAPGAAPSLQSAIEQAATTRRGGQQAVIAAISSAGSAKYFLPTFIRSLELIGGLDEHLVVLNLDANAQALCAKLHTFSLCPLYASSELPDSTEELLAASSGDSHEDHHFPYFSIGWLKTRLAEAIVSMGYPCMATDMDIVFFQNPFPAFDQSAHIVSTPDNDDWTKEDREWKIPSPNLGIVYFPPTEMTLQFLRRWLLLVGGWDQDEFRNTLIRTMEDTPEFELQILSLNNFPNFCASDWNGLHGALAERQKGWAEICPKETREQWMMFHVACARVYWDAYDQFHDRGLVKRDMLSALLDLHHSTPKDFDVQA